MMSKKENVELARSCASRGDSRQVLDIANQLIAQQHIEGYYIFVKLKLHQNIDRATIFEDISNSILKIPKKNYENNDIEAQKCLTYLLDFLNHNQQNKKNLVYYCENLEPHTTKEESYLIITKTLPYNFGWVIPNALAGSSIPNQNDLETFTRMGIKHVITCLEDPLPYSPPNNLQLHFFKVNDRNPPTIEDLIEMLGIILLGEPTVVHCQGGRGRTNVVLVADLMRKDPSLGVHKATEIIRELRPTLLFDNSELNF